MKLSEWLEKSFTHVSTEKFITKNGNTLTVPDICVDLTYGLLSTNSKEEFSKLVFHLMPTGTIVDEIPDDYYEGKLLLLRTYLTKKMLKDQNYKKLLDILERRDASHWAKPETHTTKTAEIKKGEETIVFKFEGI